MIADMVMPVMDGAATILALRTISPDVRIIDSCGQGTESTMKAGRLRSVGITHFIAKPYTAETLLHSLARGLGRESTSSVTVPSARGRRQASSDNPRVRRPPAPVVT